MSLHVTSLIDLHCSNTKKVWTVNDLEEKRKNEAEAVAQWGSGKRMDTNAVKIGKEALELTNNFRKQHKLPPLQWHQALCEIGFTHSKGILSMI